jgi:hypothetical protein
MGFRDGQSTADQIDFGRRRLDSLFRLLLKHMQPIHCAGELNGIDGPVRSPGVVFDNFEHARTAKSFENLCGCMSPALLGKINGVADLILNRFG